MHDLNHHTNPSHCRACKERVAAMLTAIFGECKINHQFPWPTSPDDYAGQHIATQLQRIRRELGNLRGHRDFIKSPVMPPCDYFLTDPLCIVEFDESQHFSRARLATLSAYPNDVPLGFSRERWQQLCRQIDANDDEPIDRDERRAWYDTLRDLLPAIHGFQPTVRLYADEFQWCALDPRSADDQDTLKKQLAMR